jgi:hypothetical protein
MKAKMSFLANRKLDESDEIPPPSDIMLTMKEQANQMNHRSLFQQCRQAQAGSQTQSLLLN